MTAPSTLALLDRIANMDETAPIATRPAPEPVAVVEVIVTVQDRASRYHGSTAVGR